MPDGKLTQQVLRKAAHALQLHFDTPHAMICFDAARRLRETCSAQAYDAACRKLLDYVNESDRLDHPAMPLTPAGEPDADDEVAGMRQSLAEHKVLNAAWYGQRLLDAGRHADLAQEALRLAAHEVDGLGHTFIFTETALRLMRDAADETTRSAILLALMEYLSRKASVERPQLQWSGAGWRHLAQRACERVGLLGHNVIFARSLHLRRDDLPDDLFEHALAQLERNIDASEDEFTVDDLRSRSASEPAGRPEAVLGEFVASGDTELAVAAVRGFMSNGVGAPEVASALVTVLCRVDVTQSHYVIFPEAVRYLIDHVDADYAELALAQVARMACGAAERYGMRQVGALPTKGGTL